MKRCMALLTILVFLILNAAISVAQQQDTSRYVKFVSEIKNLPLTPRSKAEAAPDISKHELYEKGYIPIGYLDVSWEVASVEELELNQDRIGSAITRALLDRAAPVGGDLVEMGGKPELVDTVPLRIGKSENSFCTRYQTDPKGGKGHCVSYGTGTKGACVAIRIGPKGDECVAWEVLSDPNTSKIVVLKAPVWRRQPYEAAQVVAAIQGNAGAISRVTAMGLTIPPNPFTSEIYLGHTERIRALLDSSYSPNVLLRDEIGSRDKLATPLHWAVSREKTAIVRLLLERGADPNRGAPDVEDGTSLHWAVRNANVEIAQLLIAHHADVNSHAAKGGQTPLCVAADAARSQDNPKLLAVVELLLAHGADAGAYDDKGNTPLHLAFNTQVMRALLKAGARVNAAATDGETPLMATVRGLRVWYDLGPMRTLLEAGADPSLRDRKGWTALDHAQDDLKFAKGHHGSTYGLQQGVDLLRTATASRGK